LFGSLGSKVSQLSLVEGAGTDDMRDPTVIDGVLSISEIIFDNRDESS
jgi:hypothetical protein